MSGKDFFMNNGWINFILLLSLFVSVSAQAELMPNASPVTTNFNSTNLIQPATNSYIVTLRREADHDGCTREFSIQRRQATS
jgi:hypothetical protein